MRLDAPPDPVAEETAAFVLGLRARGLRDRAVLGALERVPRDHFAPRRFADLSRSDVALPLPHGQTMTAPGHVARMLSALGLEAGQHVLEIGTGSGYVSALLVHLGGRVTSFERYGALADAAALRFGGLDLTRAIDLRVADGLAPRRTEVRFDRIILNGSVTEIPGPVTDLLAPGGRLVGAVVAAGAPRLVVREMAEDGTVTDTLGVGLRIAPLIQGLPAVR